MPSLNFFIGPAKQQQWAASLRRTLVPHTYGEHLLRYVILTQGRKGAKK